jgi:hypothetical protein
VIPLANGRFSAAATSATCAGAERLRGWKSVGEPRGARGASERSERSLIVLCHKSDKQAGKLGVTFDTEESSQWPAAGVRLTSDT